jgi:hypothetical protein
MVYVVKLPVVYIVDEVVENTVVLCPSVFPPDVHLQGDGGDCPLDINPERVGIGKRLPDTNTYKANVGVPMNDTNGASTPDVLRVEEPP